MSSTMEEVAVVARRPYWREDDARVIVDAWKRSEESLAAFARRHGLHPHRVARWASKITDSESSSGALSHRSAGDDAQRGADRDPAEWRLAHTRLPGLRRGGSPARARRAGREDDVLTLPASVRIYIAAEAVDLRRGFDGLGSRDAGADPGESYERPSLRLSQSPQEPGEASRVGPHRVLATLQTSRAWNVSHSDGTDGRRAPRGGRCRRVGLDARRRGPEERDSTRALAALAPRVALNNLRDLIVRGELR